VLYTVAHRAGLYYTEDGNQPSPSAWQLEARWVSIRSLQRPLMPAFMQLDWGLNTYLWSGWVCVAIPLCSF